MSESASHIIPQDDDDLLWQQLKTIPAFRALLRSVEARFYQVVDLPHPILDLGCGDGHFAQATFAQPITAGIDPWWGPLIKAQRSEMYELPMQAMGDSLPFADQTFSSGFSNSVLEHIPDIQPVLNEVSRVMKPGAPFVLTVPSNYFTEYLGGGRFFDNLGLESVGSMYRDLFNRISRHAHTDPPDVWAKRLALAGFSVERWQYYFSKEALRTLEIGHAQGIPSAVLHALTGHWILGPWKSNLKWTEQWVRPYYEEDFPEHGAYLFFLARKSADTPLDEPLPPPQPYSLADLQSPDTAASFERESTAEDYGEEVIVPSSEPDVDAKTMEEAGSSLQGMKLIVPGILVALTLLFAIQGQSALRAAPDQPLDGLRWFGISAASFLLLLLSGRTAKEREGRTWQLPKISAVPRRLWLILPALLLAFVAYRLAISPEYTSPLLPLFVWLGAAALTWYALWQEPAEVPVQPTKENKERTMFTIKASILLFLAALLLRVYELGELPFILNGTEASMGLGALDVASGLQTNPFGTGWLTNPNLALFLQAIPLKIWGPSTEALRSLSAFVGALTVPAVFILGQRLYGRAVGLVAAVLIAGSHFHIHYSRSGLTNAWDALITLLVLGLIAIAWQQDPKQNRRIWLAAGTAAGFSMYLFTSSHLLPIMLLALGVVLILFDRLTVKKQWRHVIAMALVALVIALPLLLYYQSAPGVFMERAQSVGILDNQSGWLSDEAVRTGTSTLEVLGNQFWQAALAFNATVDTGTSYGPTVPLLNYVAGLFAFLGFILALFRFPQIRYSMLVVWVTVTIVFAGALLLDPPESRRLIIALPAVTLLAAIALEGLVSAVTRQTSSGSVHEAGASAGRNSLAYFVILLLVAAAIATYDIGFYFGAYRSNHQFGDRNTEVADKMSKYLNTLDDHWIAHFYGPPIMYSGFPTIPFLAAEFSEGENLFDVSEAGSPQAGYETRNQTFILLPERLAEMESLRAIYPSGSERIFSGYYADPLFYVYEVTGSSP